MHSSQNYTLVGPLFITVPFYCGDLESHPSFSELPMRLGVWAVGFWGLRLGIGGLPGFIACRFRALGLRAGGSGAYVVGY